MENAFDVILYIMMILQQIGDGCVQVTFFTFGYRYFFIVITGCISGWLIGMQCMSPH